MSFAGKPASANPQVTELIMVIQLAPPGIEGGINPTPCINRYMPILETAKLSDLILDTGCIDGLRVFGKVVLGAENRSGYRVNICRDTRINARN